MLVHVVERTAKSQLIDTIVIATSVQAVDDPIEALCIDRDFLCFRGHPSDLLERYYRAAEAYQLEVIVRITGDCPLIDAELVDLTITRFLE